MVSLAKRLKKLFGMVTPEESKTVLSNFAFLSVIQAINYLLPVVILPYLFRVIGPGKFGLIAFAQAFVQYFMILTDYGFNITATREISLSGQDPREVSRIFSAVMTVKLILTFVCFLLLCVIVYFIPRFRNDWPVYLLSFGAVIGNTLFPVWFFQGIEKMKHISYLNIIGGIFMVTSIFVLVRRAEDYMWVPFITSCSFLITGIAAQYVVFKKFRLSFKMPGYKGVQRQLKKGWDIFISNVAINAYTVTRIFVVGLLTNTTVTGFYAIAERIANAVQTFPLLSLSQAIFPRLSKIYGRNNALAFALMRQIQQITVYIGSICLVLIFFASPWIVKVVCGADYPETVMTLRLLLAAVFIVSANAFRVQFLLVCGRTRIYSGIHIIMSMIGLPLIFLMVISYGYLGAAVASVIIETGIFILTYLSVGQLKFGPKKQLPAL